MALADEDYSKALRYLTGIRLAGERLGDMEDDINLMIEAATLLAELVQLFMQKAVTYEN